jgi:hypothetical protein
MRTIADDTKLLAWLFEEMKKAKPRVQVTPALIEHANSISDEIADVGFLARYDYECWEATFGDLLAVGKPGVARCGQPLLTWLAGVYAEVAAGDPEKPVPLARINLIAIRLLDLEPNYLVISKRKGSIAVESTRACEREFHVRIRTSSPAARDRHVNGFGQHQWHYPDP